MQAHEFASKCQFYVKNGQMHGKAIIRLQDGSHVTIQTKPGEGVPMSLLTHAVAMREASGNVGGLFGDVWKQAKKTAGSMATGKLAGDLLKKATIIAKSDLGGAVLSVVPGGTAALTAIKLGSQAADLLGKVTQGDRKAIAQVAHVVQLAEAGVPVAQTAQNILKAVHVKGKAKGVFPRKRKLSSKRAAAHTILARVPRRGVTSARSARSGDFRSAPRGDGHFAAYWAGLRSALGQVV
jgi:hypothetical protein